MGYQLWTSPLTGYRRRGTRLVELHSVLGSQITARAIFEPLQSCPADAPALEMYQMLEQRDFDVAGVRTKRDGPVIGFVRRSRLKGGTVQDHVGSLSADNWIQETLPLAVLMERLKDREFVFVRIEPDGAGIITRADLNKPPVRVYLFGLISLLEMHLSYWVREDYPGDTWHPSLKPDRMRETEKVQAERRRRKQDLELIDCLQFCDKRDLILAREHLCNELGLGSKGKATTNLKDAEVLRNTLAHSQYDLVPDDSWKELLQLIEWMEALVRKSDDSVEQRARQRAKQVGIAALW